jgi:hypothetical protein
LSFDGIPKISYHKVSQKVMRIEDTGVVGNLLRCRDKASHHVCFA